MDRSFFYKTDAEIASGSANFSTKITASPTSYGLVAAQATAYAALNTTFQSAYTAAINPDTRTKGAVAAKNAAKQNLQIMASNLAKIINGTPTVTDSQKIDLGLAVRTIPQPVSTLGTPNKFSVGLDATGSLTLKWKCASPRATGMVYQVWRRTTATGEFEYLGGSGDKKFVDSTLPAGSSQVTYQIQAVRSTAVGAFAQFNVNFGVSGATVSAVEDTAAKKAA